MVRRLAPLVLVGALFLSAVPVGAQSEEQRLTEVEREIRVLNSRIAAQKGERSAIQTELAGSQIRLEELRGQLSAAETSLAAVEGSIAEHEGRLAELEQQLTVLKRQLAETQVDIRETRRLVRDQAVELYMAGAGGMAALMLTSSADVGELELGMHYAGEVIAGNEALINSLEILRRQEEEQRDNLEARQGEAEAVLAGLEQRRGELEQQRAEVEARRQEVLAELEQARDLLARVNQDISEYEGELSALEKESKQLEAEIAARQSRGGESPGMLAWPINGPVTSWFGFRIHPIFGTRKLHAGIDISAGAGTPIKASEAGTVILAHSYGGYGRAVVIDHGGGLSTLYAHQSSILVGEGQEVSRGQVIGYVGCTGYCTGPHLHFETRESGTPVDPMKYLS